MRINYGIGISASLGSPLVRYSHPATVDCRRVDFQLTSIRCLPFPSVPFTYAWYTIASPPLEPLTTEQCPVLSNRVLPC